MDSHQINETVIDPAPYLIAAVAAVIVAIIALGGMVLGLLRGWIITRARFEDMRIERDSWRNWSLRQTHVIEQLGETNRTLADTKPEHDE